MDAPSAIDQLPFVGLGEVVLFTSRGRPSRAAIVGHVQPDGRTCDLVVILDGDGGDLSRQAWQLGHSVTRVRTDVPYREDKPSEALHWEFRPPSTADLR